MNFGRGGMTHSQKLVNGRISKKALLISPLGEPSTPTLDKKSSVTKMPATNSSMKVHRGQSLAAVIAVLPAPGTAPAHGGCYTKYFLYERVNQALTQHMIQCYESIGSQTPGTHGNLC